MNKLGFAAAALAVIALIACSSDDDPNTAAPSETAAGQDAGNTGTGTSGNTQTGTSSGSTSGDPGDKTDSGTDSGADGTAPASCEAAKATLLVPIDKTSTGEVVKLADSVTIYVDASAGGPSVAKDNPRIYVNLETLTRVDVTDKTAAASKDWDLALKRPILFTNSGDGGSGQGGAALVDKAFADVTKADIPATLPAESFFDTDCNAKVDATNAVKTSFDGWYDYNLSDNTLAPHPGTWIVKGGTGKTYKVAITSYYANPDGTAGQAGGRFTMKVAPLN